MDVKKISNKELKRRQKQKDSNDSKISTEKKTKRNEWTLDDF